MAFELVRAMSQNRDARHMVHHDVESFIWVIYYATLRRLGYVNRPLQGMDAFNKDIIKDIKISFKTLFGHVDLNNILRQRVSATPPTLLFEGLLPSLPSPVANFFEELHFYVTVELRFNTRSDEHPFGQATHDAL